MHNNNTKAKLKVLSHSISMKVLWKLRYGKVTSNLRKRLFLNVSHCQSYPLRDVCLFLLLEREEGREGLERGEGRKKERERNIDWLPFVCVLIRDWTHKPRYVPWLGTKPLTFWLAGWCQTNWTTPARPETFISYVKNFTWVCWTISLISSFMP